MKKLFNYERSYHPYYEYEDKIPSDGVSSKIDTWAKKPNLDMYTPYAMETTHRDNYLATVPDCFKSIQCTEDNIAKAKLAGKAKRKARKEGTLTGKIAPCEQLFVTKAKPFSTEFDDQLYAAKVYWQELASNKKITEEDWVFYEPPELVLHMQAIEMKNYYHENYMAYLHNVKAFAIKQEDLARYIDDEYYKLIDRIDQAMQIIQPYCKLTHQVMKDYSYAGTDGYGEPTFAKNEAYEYYYSILPAVNSLKDIKVLSDAYKKQLSMLETLIEQYKNTDELKKQIRDLEAEVLSKS
tara:strand:+ start:567 stop:1451 length:885 start_codon:yes stop_codon:yes gene_type:complete